MATMREALSGVRSVEAQAVAARRLLPRLARMGREEKDALLKAMAVALEQGAEAVFAANRQDVGAAQAAGLPGPLVKRLELTPKKLASMVAHVRAVADLPDPVGEMEQVTVRPNGLRVGTMRVPIGLIGIVYESRPDVTVDAAALCLKTGNAVLLRGGREAWHTNAALHALMAQVLAREGLEDAVQLVEDPDRSQVQRMFRMTGLLDLLVPRGGADLIQTVVREARVPVLETGVGNCHTFVDRDADLDKAERIVLNAKVQNPAVCNAMETLLVDAPVAESFLPRVGAAYARHGVQLRACPRSLPLLRASGARVREATEEDYATEFLDLILAVRVVDGLDEALEHIARYGTRHSEAIVTENYTRAWRFLREVDAAAVYVNASTRFTDGYEFGLGAELGISTQKLHARGPVGPRQLTTTKYVVLGEGQVRE